MKKEKQRQMVRDFIAVISSKPLSNEECDNLWIYGCTKPDAEMLSHKAKSAEGV